MLCGVWSGAASQRAYSPAASYGPSKAAVNNMSYNMAVEYGPQQVRVNCILPALIETELAHTRVKEGEDWYCNCSCSVPRIAYPRCGMWRTCACSRKLKFMG
jgi:NAD(P)-dependent dehydrogenase (short-subunit alcohol dehydrogenase family)